MNEMVNKRERERVSSNPSAPFLAVSSCDVMTNVRAHLEYWSRLFIPENVVGAVPEIEEEGGGRTQDGEGFL